MYKLMHLVRRIYWYKNASGPCPAGTFEYHIGYRLAKGANLCSRNNHYG